MARIDWTIPSTYYSVSASPGWVTGGEYGAKENREAREMEAMRNNLRVVLCARESSYEYLHSRFGNKDVILSLHGGDSGRANAAVEKAIDFYFSLYRSLRKSQTYPYDLGLVQLCAIESFVPGGEENGESTAVVRTHAGNYIPAAASDTATRISLTNEENWTLFHREGPDDVVDVDVVVERDALYDRTVYRAITCGMCRENVMSDSVYRYIVSHARPRDASVRHDTLCLSCALSLWRERGRFLQCRACSVFCPETDCDVVETMVGEKVLCQSCRQDYTICEGCGGAIRIGVRCSHCERNRIREDEVRTRFIPSRCKWEKEFSLLLPSGETYLHDSFLSVTRSQGEVSNDGIDAIARLLSSEGHSLNFESLSKKDDEAGRVMDVTQDISYVHGKGLPSVAKKIESFYYRHGQEKPGKTTLQRIGEIAAEYTPKADTTTYYALTREFDHSRDFYCHSASCWWSQYPLSFCYMKRYGGMVLVGRDREDMDENHYCLSRGMVFPLYGDGEKLSIREGLPDKPDAYFLFNVYGVDGYVSMANALSRIVGMGSHERVNIQPLSGEIWINGRITTRGDLTHSFGYLIYPEGMELPSSLDPEEKYRMLSLVPAGERILKGWCHCGR